MLSALIIILVFGSFLVFLNRTERIADPASRVMISFFGSLSTLSILYFCLLLLPSKLGWASRFILLIGLAALVGIFYLNRYYVRSSLLDVAHASGWLLNTRNDQTGTLGALGEGRERSFYRLVFCGSFFFILFANIANPSPSNWDSNSYNVARISSMIAGASPFVEQTSVARQAILSLSHDVLFYPDILIHNTRGLGLVCALEFIVLLIIITQLSLIFISRLRNSSIPNSYISVYPSLILSLCLLLSSDMQAMQSVITKNDLVITLCFTCGLYLACKYISNEISAATLFMGSLLIAVYSSTSKSYGIISFLPLGIIYSFVLLRALRHLELRQVIKPRLSLMSLTMRAKILVAHVVTSPTSIAYVAAFLGLTGAQLYIDFRIRQFAIIHYFTEVTRISQSWTNSGNGFEKALLIFLINTSRSAVSISAYSLSSLPYLGQWLSSPLTKLFNLDILTLDFGTGGGTEFKWPVYSHDTSHTSFLVIASFIFSLIAWRRLRRQYSFYLMLDMSRLDKQLSTLFLIILSSSVLAYLTITYSILYQPWIGRFLGPSYVPLIPVSSFILAQYLHLNSKEMRLLSFLFNAKVFLPLVSMLMLVSHVNASSLRVDFSLAFSSKYTGIPLAERRYAKHIAKMTKTEPSTYGPLLKHLRLSGYKQRYICTGGDSWMLTPLMISMENKSFSGSNLVSIPTIACDKKLGLATSPNSASLSDQKALAPKFYHQDDTEYIYLP